MTKTILVVDDDKELQDLYAAMLADTPTEIITAFDGGEALELLEVSAPDLIILDIILDEMMGDVLYKRIKADSRWSRIPVVIVSVLGAGTCKRLVEPDPATVFLRKPFSREHLLDAVWSSLQNSG
jgi:two-component system alkaline phosphatase synthesis response regulator PhoP